MMALSVSSPLEGLEDLPTIGFICPLYTELAAVIATFDEELESTEIEEVEYYYGRIHNRIAVAVQFPFDESGPTVAEEYGSKLLEAHPSLKHPTSVCLLVGTASGVWTPTNDVRLGDVVIATKVWDRSTTNKGQSEHISRALRQKLPRFLHSKEKLGKLIVYQIQTMQSHQDEEGDGEEHEWSYPGQVLDILFRDDYIHAPGTSCASCDSSSVEPRPVRDPNLPRVHSGLIACGSSSLRESSNRQMLRSENVLAVEMEAGGLSKLNLFFIIRGICDYADSHKDDRWEPYAAATAAACARLLVDFLVKPPQRQRTSASASVRQDISVPPSVDYAMSSKSPSPKPSIIGKQPLRNNFPPLSSAASSSLPMELEDPPSSASPGKILGTSGPSIATRKNSGSAPQQQDYSAWRPPSNQMNAPKKPPPSVPARRLANHSHSGPGAPASVASFRPTPAEERAGSTHNENSRISAWLSQTREERELVQRKPVPAPPISHREEVPAAGSALSSYPEPRSLPRRNGSPYPSSIPSSESSYLADQINSIANLNLLSPAPVISNQQTGSAKQSVLGDGNIHRDQLELHDRQVAQKTIKFRVECCIPAESVKYRGIEQSSGIANTGGSLGHCDVELGYQEIAPWYESLRFLLLRPMYEGVGAKIWLPIDQINVKIQDTTLSIDYCAPNRAGGKNNVEILFEIRSESILTFIQVLLLRFGPLTISLPSSSYWAVADVKGRSFTDSFSPYGISDYMMFWSTRSGINTCNVTAFGDRLDFIFASEGPTETYLELSPLFCLDYTRVPDDHTLGETNTIAASRSNAARYVATFGNFLDDGRSKRKAIPVTRSDVCKLLNCALPMTALKSAGDSYLWYAVAYFDDVSFSFPKNGLKAETVSQAHLSIWKAGNRVLFLLRSIQKQDEVENPFRWKSWEITIDPDEAPKSLGETWIPGKSSRKPFKFSDWRRRVTFEQHTIYAGHNISLTKPDPLYAMTEEGTFSAQKLTWSIHFDGRRGSGDKGEESYKEFKSHLQTQPDSNKPKTADATFQKKDIKGGYPTKPGGNPFQKKEIKREYPTKPGGKPDLSYLSSPSGYTYSPDPGRMEIG